MVDLEATDCPLCGEALNGRSCPAPYCDYREAMEIERCDICGENVPREQVAAEVKSTRNRRTGTKTICESHVE